MDMMTVGILGLAAVLLAVQLKSIRAEYAAYIIFGAGVVLTFYIVGRLETVTVLFEQLTSELSIPPVYIGALLKMIGIAYIAQFCAGLCKDAGYQAIAVQIETFGKLTILSLGLPVVVALMDTMRGFLYGGSG